jgi:hypothetical protein
MRGICSVGVGGDGWLWGSIGDIISCDGVAKIYSSLWHDLRERSNLGRFQGRASSATRTGLLAVLASVVLGWLRSSIIGRI